MQEIIEGFKIVSANGTELDCWGEYGTFAEGFSWTFEGQGTIFKPYIESKTYLEEAKDVMERATSSNLRMNFKGAKIVSVKQVITTITEVLETIPLD